MFTMFRCPDNQRNRKKDSFVIIFELKYVLLENWNSPNRDNFDENPQYMF